MSKKNPKPKIVLNRIESLFEDLESELVGKPQDEQNLLRVGETRGFPEETKLPIEGPDSGVSVAPQKEVSQEISVQPEVNAIPEVRSMSDELLAALAAQRDIVEPAFEQPRMVETTTKELLPLVVHFPIQQGIGSVEISDDSAGRVWSEDERSLVEEVVDQLGLALENSRLFQETQSALSETRTLYAITSAATKSLDLKATLDELLTQVLTAIGIDAGLISILNPSSGKLELAVHQNLPESMVKNLEQKGFAGTLCEAVFIRRQAISLSDMTDLNAVPKYLEQISRPLINAGMHSYLGVPLESKGRVLGTLCTFGYGVRPERPADVTLIQVAGQQIGISIENSQLYTSAQRRSENLGVLNEMGRTLSSLLDVNAITEAMYTYTSRLMDTSTFFVALYDQKTQIMSLPVVFNNKTRMYLPDRILSGGLSDYIIRTHEPLLMNGNVVEQMEELEVKYTTVEGVQPPVSWLGVPLLYSDQILGVIVLQSSLIPNLYSEDDRNVLIAVASQTAIAIQNARLYQEEQRRRQVADALREIARAISSTLELGEVTNRVLDQVANLVDYDTVSIQLIQEGKRRIIGARGLATLKAESGGASNPEAGQSWRPIADDPLVAEVVDMRQPMLVSDTRLERRWLTRPETLNVRSWLIAPLNVGEDVVGLLTLDHSKPEVYNQDTIELVNSVAAQAAVAVQNANLFQQTQAALSETAGLYQASAEINTAQSYLEILNALRRHTIAGKTAQQVCINYFDRVWTESELPEWVEVLARWTPEPVEGFMSRFPLEAYPCISRLMRMDQALIIEDIHADPRLDEVFRELYEKLYRAKSSIFTPLVVGAQWIGFINATYPGLMTFSEEDVRRMMALSGQAAVAIQNIRSVALAEDRAREALERSEELSLVNRVVSAMVSSADLSQVLDSVAGELLNAFELAHAGIWLLSQDHSAVTVLAEKSSQQDTSSVGMKVPVKGNPSVEQVLSTRRSLTIPEAQTSPLLAPIHVLINQRGVQTMAMFPIIAGGDVIGVISLDVVEKGRVFTHQEMSLGETLVGQISTSIQNANLYEQTQRALAETETLYQASAELNTAQSYDDILNILRKTTILGHPNAGHVTMALFDRPWIGDNIPEWYIPLAHWSNSPVMDSLSAHYPIGAGEKAQKLIKPDAVVYIEHAATDPRLDDTARNVYNQMMNGKSLVTAPLFAGGQWIGYVNAVYTEHTPVEEKDIRPLKALAGQAAVAVQNLRLLEETRRRATQLETAAEIARDTSGTLALDTLLNRAVNLIRDRYGFYHSSIFLLDDSRVNAMVRASTGEAGEEMLRQGHKLVVGSQSIIGSVTATGEVLVINDVSQNPIHRANPLLPFTRAELAIPLMIGNRIMGALDVQASNVDAFSADDVSVLRTLADQLAVAVDNARSYELAQQAIDETRRRVQELSMLFNMGTSLAAASMNIEEIADIVAKTFIEAMAVPKVSISLIDQETSDLHTVADLQRSADGQGYFTAQTIKDVYSLVEFPATSLVIDTLQPLINQASDPKGDPWELAYMRDHNIKTLVVIPLALKGEAFGIIELECIDKEHQFSQDQITLALTLANSAGSAFENARLYEEQRLTAEQLREVDKLKSQFLANMSHELRTPLNSIIGFSRVILKGIDGPISDLQKQDLTAINSAGQHLLQLINDVLDISKIEAGKMELTFDDHVNMADLITSAMSTAIGLTKDKPIRLLREIPPDLPVVRADPTRVRQVLINFLSNAAKFTDEGSITLRAEVQLNPEGRREMVVSVIDTGPGITEQDQKKLFLPFSQVDASPTRKVGGSGLGLSISRLLIELHGGRIGLTSEVGKGSTFYFTLPLEMPEPQAPAEAEGEGSTGRHVILAIDDDQQVLNLYKRYLNEHGYEVIPLVDSSQAVEVARQNKPFAITLDVLMPGQDGWQVLEALKQDPETRSIPVIICSIIENEEKGFNLGAVGYLPKPFLEDDLVKALSGLNADGSIQEILVVDDDLDDLRLVERILQRAGRFKIRLAHGGPEGLVAIQTQPPQTVILDLFMPELDGFTLLETMQEDPALRQIPVVIFTAGDLTEAQRKRLSEFTNQLLFKSSFKEADLLNSIENVLKRLNPRSDASRPSSEAGASIEGIGS